LLQAKSAVPRWYQVYAGTPYVGIVTAVSKLARILFR